jgi:hypothetical protein
MSLRKLIGVVPVVAALAIAAPVASASAQATPVGPSSIPCYPYPAFCGPNGQPWWSFPSPSVLPFPFGIPMPPLTGPPIVHFGPGPVQLPTGS